MDRKNMQLAANLLAKALRTDYDAEAIALLQKSYSLLAQVITAYDDSVGPAAQGGRRRERRLLRDRRATRRLGLFGGPADRKSDPVGAYRRLDQDRQGGAPGQVDFEA
jgi:hypothetical protein